MIPTITDLNKAFTPANDQEAVVLADNIVVSVTKAPANDKSDASEKTMDRIMSRHNGHRKGYRDTRGRYTTKEKAAANDKVDASEKTMGRIMDRHNGHDNLPDKMDAANENRIIHNYDGVVPQAKKKADVVLVEEENPLIEMIASSDPLEEKTRDDEHKTSRFKDSSVDANDEVVPLLRDIETNTSETVHALHVLTERIDDFSVDQLRSRERNIEKDKGYIAGPKESISSMDQKGKEKEKKGLLENLVGATTGLVTTAAVGTAGFIGQYLFPETQKDNKGGGFDGSEQAPKSKASPKKSSTPPSAPRPEPISKPSMLGYVSEKYESGGRGVATISSGLKDEGGASYGSHQLSAKDGMPAFLKSPEGKPFKKFFDGLKPGTTAFNSRYKQLVKAHGSELDKAQQDYFARVYYTPTAAYAKKKGIDVSQRGVQEALYSMLQHGMSGRKKIIDRTVKSGVDLDDPDSVIKELYHQRGKYASHFASRAATIDRYRKEVKDALVAQHSMRGVNLNKQSAQGGAKQNIVVVSAPNNSTTINSNSKTPTPQKSRVPPAKNESWMEMAKHYFGF